MLNKFLVLFLLSVPLWAAAPVFVDSDGTIVQVVDGAVTFETDQSINTCTLAAGSEGSVEVSGSGTGCTYTPPTSLVMRNFSHGCPAAPNDSIWNTPVNNFPLMPNSATLAALYSGTLNGLSQWGTNTVVSGGLTESLVFNYTPSNNGAFNVPSGVDSISDPSITGGYPYLIQAGFYEAAATGGDRHMTILVMDGGDCEYQDIYRPYPLGAYSGCTSCTAQSGWKYGGMSQALTSTGATTAGGTPLSSLNIRYEEIVKGAIHHMLAVQIPNGYKCGPSSAYAASNYGGDILWPARADSSVGTTGSTTCIDMGQVVRLPSSYDISGFSPMAQVILTAFKTYGGVIMDGTVGSWGYALDWDAHWDHDAMAAIYEIQTSALRTTDFEFVDISSAMISSTSAAVRDTNGYETPSGMAIVQACNAGSECSDLRPVLQGVNIGLESTGRDAPVLNVMAGTPQFTIPINITGATDLSYTCVDDGTGLGTLTSGGLFTAPATQTGLTEEDITCTSTADSNVDITFHLVVYPNEVIRINVGSKAGTITNPVIPYDGSKNYGPDANGNYWWDDVGRWMRGGSITRDQSYQQSGWQSPAADDINGAENDIGLWYTSRRDCCSDLIYPAYVPNGIYSLKVLFGDKSSAAGTSTMAATQWEQAIDSQGKVLDSSYNPYDHTASAGEQGDPITANFGSVAVTDNRFYVSFRSFGGASQFANVDAIQVQYIGGGGDTGTSISGQAALTGQAATQ